MSNKILYPALVSMLAEKSSHTKKQTEVFLKAFFQVTEDALRSHEPVKIKGFGTFKLNRVDSRKSVDVSTGAETEIPAHYKIVFTPSKEMAGAVNKDFSWLEIVEINEEMSDRTIEEQNLPTPEDPITEENTMPLPEINGAHLSEQEERQSERLGEEMEEDFGNIEPVEPLGPLDPQDPEPGTPEPLDASQAQQPEEPDDLFKDLDYLKEPEPEPIYITKEEYEKLVTKDNIKSVVKSFKKLRNRVDTYEEKSRRKSNAAIIWTIIICTALIIAGFFILYQNLYTRLTGELAEMVEANQNHDYYGPDYPEVNYEEEPSTTQEEGDALINTELSTPAEQNNKNVPPPVKSASTGSKTQTGIDNIDSNNPQKYAGSDKTKSASSTASASNGKPVGTQEKSEIKAMDKVTSTRYLTTMAKEHYGNYNLWPYIYLENEAILGHPDRIKPGTQVVIPNIEKYGINPSNPQDIEKARRLGVEIYKRYNF